MPQIITQTDNQIDLNCDLGEYEGLNEGVSDSRIMPFISSCNIACGAHAGNEAVIQQTIQCAIKHQVSMGAHPSYPDRERFGRQVMAISHQDLEKTLKQQIIFVKTAIEVNGVSMQHVKLHGALYNQAAIDESLAQLIVQVVASIDENLFVYGLAHSKMACAAKERGLKFIAEGFADRAYTNEKTLVPRNQPGACIESFDAQLQQVLRLLNEGQVMSASGQVIPLKVGTICLHGDHDHAIQTAQILSQGIKKAGFKIKSPI